jgi:hypothetical protein
MLCAMALAHAALVFPKADLAPPLERLFHAPVVPDGVGKPDGITGQGGQAPALLERDRPAHFAVRLHQTNTGAIGPRALHASALDLRGDPRGTCC